MGASMKFDVRYQEAHHLPDGRQLRLRSVRPDDKKLIQDGFSRLSMNARQRRFLAAKQTLSDVELQYFTEMDGFDHFALGLVALDDRGEEAEGVAIARFIRLRDRPSCAEVAVTVLDDWQGQGLGRLMLERLIEAARERGIEDFRFECLMHNREMQGLVSKVCQVVDFHRDEGLMVAIAQLPDPQLAANEQTAANPFDLLQALAVDVLELQLTLGMESFQQSWNLAFDRTDAWRDELEATAQSAFGRMET
jgi:GNAT superfamily N-acetyltransferase